MSLDHECRKKDKRLLVLLALGALIMFFDLAMPAKHRPAVYAHSWLEIQDKENRLYRFKSTGSHLDSTVKVIVADKDNMPVQITDTQLFSSLKQGRVIALRNEQKQDTVSSPASPRLAFFLGQPFSINIADAEDLTLIPGIGPVLAGNIIAHREMYGPITKPYQLEDIAGVGPRMKLKLLDYLPCSLDCE